MLFLLLYAAVPRGRAVDRLRRRGDGALRLRRLLRRRRRRADRRRAAACRARSRRSSPARCWSCSRSRSARSALKLIDTNGVELPDDGNSYGTRRQIGELLLTKYLLPFEVASFLLTVAAVCAVVLARRRRGLEELDR